MTYSVIFLSGVVVINEISIPRLAFFPIFFINLLVLGCLAIEGINHWGVLPMGVHRLGTLGGQYHPKLMGDETEAY